MDSVIVNEEKIFETELNEFESNPVNANFIRLYYCRFNRCSYFI